MLKYIRIQATGKYEMKNVIIPRLVSEVLGLSDGDYEFRRPTGFNRFSIKQQDNCIVVSSSHLTLYFNKCGEFDTIIRNAKSGKEAERLNVNFEENLDLVLTVIRSINDPSNKIFAE